MKEETKYMAKERMKDAKEGRNKVENKYKKEIIKERKNLSEKKKDVEK